ncbi:Two-component sensor histidine kinase, contains HisKA and HATPase domains [Pricia antarctica]|uniref:histidine kinase n=1 Tax=Pricia antarctica TaxID=641691 RepID=A0A1G7EGZ4_9FLAO|nr:sensor histidine kinase [Pricia antarctica]SDE62912.1 Two-component sensor histidine kinase, contains HisKA and HATPase domains [Pricia antarctica]
MKFKLTAIQLTVFSLILFLITNIFIWTSIQTRVSHQKQNLFELEQEKANNTLNQAETRLLALYTITKRKTLFLANLRELDSLNNVPTSFTAQQLAAFLRVHLNYYQAVLLDSTGTELVNAIRIEGSVILEDADKLQYKGDRNYIKEALRLKKGDVALSLTDIKYGENKIGNRSRPTMRFFTPVFDSERKTELLGLNLDPESWFNIFEDIEFGLISSQHEIYFGAENNFDKKNRTNLDEKDEYGYPLFFSKKINLENNLKWTLYTKQDNIALDAKFEKFRNQAYKTGAALSIGILFFLLVVQILHIKNRNISRLNRSIENRLQERDTLIKEIHHRVKNNLQVVASLLSLQSSFIKDEKTKMLFRYSQYRINSMGIVHEMLYKSDDLNRIDYGAYIRELVNTLIQSMKGDQSNIRLETEVENIRLNIDTSIPLGLLINEIITNSLKYGFSDSEEGTITVKMNKLSTFSYSLRIGDNGSGIPKDINFRNTKSLGLKLIHKLALQLRGNVEMDNSKIGTNYIITFQEIEQTS